MYAFCDNIKTFQLQLLCARSQKDIPLVGVILRWIQLSYVYCVCDIRATSSARGWQGSLATRARAVRSLIILLSFHAELRFLPQSMSTKYQIIPLFAAQTRGTQWRRQPQMKWQRDSGGLSSDEKKHNQLSYGRFPTVMKFDLHTLSLEINPSKCVTFFKLRQPTIAQTSSMSVFSCSFNFETDTSSLYMVLSSSQKQREVFLSSVWSGDCNSIFRLLASTSFWVLTIHLSHTSFKINKLRSP